jgi:UDP-glucose 4-epimerase
MVLITGGLGFIGSHTARALLNLGQPCVLVQRREPVLPDDLADEAGGRVFTERADITDLAALLDVGTRHKITGIIHMAGSVPWPPGADQPVPGARKAIGSLLNVLQAAHDWQVPRVGVASTIGVYGGATAQSPLREDTPLPMTAGHVIPAFKKIGELLGDYLTGVTGIEIISYRISPWGPGGNPAPPFSAAPQLVHAASRGTVPDFSALRSRPYVGSRHVNVSGGGDASVGWMGLARVPGMAAAEPGARRATGRPSLPHPGAGGIRAGRPGSGATR